MRFADRRASLTETAGAVPDDLGSLARGLALQVPFGLQGGGELGSGHGDDRFEMTQPGLGRG